MSIIATLMLVVGLAACGGGGGPHDLSLPSTPTTAPVPTTAPTATSAPASSTASLGSVGVPAVALVAHPRVPLLGVYPAPDAAHTIRELANPWLAATNDPSVQVTQVFLVEAQESTGWVKVLLPVSPNGAAGWVRAADVTIASVPFSIRIGLQARHMTVFAHGQVLWQGAVAVGAPASPTPTGQYYVRMVLKAPKPNSGFGPFAFGLSSNSGSITGFSGSDDEIGIHGTPDASSLGQAATLGSIRMPNAEITKLAAVLPLGTPVDIDS